MASRFSAAVPDRAATCAVVAGAVIAVVHLAGAAAGATTTADVVRGVLSRLGVALAFFGGGCALAWGGRRVGATMARVNDLSRQMSATAADEMASTREVVERLEVLTLKV